MPVYVCSFGLLGAEFCLEFTGLYDDVMQAAEAYAKALGGAFFYATEKE